MEAFFVKFIGKLYDGVHLVVMYIYQLCGVNPIDMTPAGGNRPIQPEDIFHVVLGDIVCITLLCLIWVGACMILRPLDKKATAMLNELIDEIKEAKEK